MTDIEAQDLLIRALAHPLADDNRRHFLIQRANQLGSGEGANIGQHQFFQLIWPLVSRGLVYIDFSQSATENWSFNLTEHGERLVIDSEYVPDRVPSYLKRISGDVPKLGSTSRLYLEEALNSFVSANYIASVMMLGVAVEAAFYEVAFSFCGWVPV